MRGERYELLRLIIEGRYKEEDKLEEDKTHGCKT